VLGWWVGVGGAWVWERAGPPAPDRQNLNHIGTTVDRLLNYDSIHGDVWGAREIARRLKILVSRLRRASEARRESAPDECDSRDLFGTLTKRITR
jgi:hypothetical protein